MNFGTEVCAEILPSYSRPTCTSRSACGNGSGRSRSASTTVKMAVVAPTASARVNTAVSTNPGCFRHRRAA